MSQSHHRLACIDSFNFAVCEKDCNCNEYETNRDLRLTPLPCQVLYIPAKVDNCFAEPWRLASNAKELVVIILKGKKVPVTSLREPNPMRVY